MNVDSSIINGPGGEWKTNMDRDKRMSTWISNLYPKETQLTISFQEELQ